MLLKDQKRITDLFHLLDKTPTVVYQDDELDEALSAAFLLENEQRSILALGCYPIEDILYSRYYWYTKFLCRYEAIYGRNGSMEQAQFKIIEAMDCEGIVDSDALEAIEQELGYVE